MTRIYWLKWLPKQNDSWIGKQKLRHTVKMWSCHCCFFHFKMLYKSISCIILVLTALFSHQTIAQNRMQGGRDAKWGESPWQVSLRLIRMDDTLFGAGHYCGGVLIKSNIVLTAAVCVHDSKICIGLQFRYHFNTFKFNFQSQRPMCVSWVEIWTCSLATDQRSSRQPGK